MGKVGINLGPKWRKAFWADLAERTLSALCFGILALVAGRAVTAITWTLAWSLVALPTILTFLKGLIANLATPGTPSASFVNVDSYGEGNRPAA